MAKSSSSNASLTAKVTAVPEAQPAQLPCKLGRCGVQMLVIFLLGLAAYANTMHVPFVFDDLDGIVRNATLTNLANYLKPSELFSSRFVGNLSFALNHAVLGLNLPGYHLTNLAVHLSTALLVYFMVRLLLTTPRLAADSRVGDFASYLPFCVALIFVAHPVQTQAITYVIQRFASLAAMFYVGSIVCYLKFRLVQTAQRSRWVYLAFSLLAALLAVRTKEIAFTLPFILLLVELLFFEGSVVRRLGMLVPYGLIAALIPLSLILAKTGGGGLASAVTGATSETAAIPRAYYLLTQFDVIMTYVRLLVLPVGLHIDYQTVVYTSLFQPPVFFAFVCLVALFSVACVFSWRGFKGRNALFSLFGFGIFWFFLSLSIESSFIPIRDTLFEHRMYLPSIGFILSFCCLAVAFLPGSAGNLKIPVPLVLLLALSAVLATATFVRNIVWQDAFSLWEDNVEKDPLNDRGLVNLAVSYQMRGMFKEAQRQYERALEINGKNMTAMYGLALNLRFQKDYEGAQATFKRYLVLLPNSPDILIQLGMTYNDQGKFAEAEKCFEKAMTDPKNPKALYERGLARQQQGKLREAVADYTNALKYKPDYPDAANDMAIALVQLKRTPEALEYFKKALVLDPNNAAFQKNYQGALTLLKEEGKKVIVK